MNNDYILTIKIELKYICYKMKKRIHFYKKLFKF